MPVKQYLWGTIVSDLNVDDGRQVRHYMVRDPEGKLWVAEVDPETPCHVFDEIHVMGEAKIAETSDFPNFMRASSVLNANRFDQLLDETTIVQLGSDTQIRPKDVWFERKSDLESASSVLYEGQNFKAGFLNTPSQDALIEEIRGLLNGVDTFASTAILNPKLNPDTLSEEAVSKLPPTLSKLVQEMFGKKSTALQNPLRFVDNHELNNRVKRIQTISSYRWAESGHGFNNRLLGLLPSDDIYMPPISDDVRRRFELYRAIGFSAKGHMGFTDGETPSEKHHINCFADSFGLLMTYLTASDSAQVRLLSTVLKMQGLRNKPHNFTAKALSYASHAWNYDVEPEDKAEGLTQLNLSTMMEIAARVANETVMFDHELGVFADYQQRVKSFSHRYDGSKGRRFYQALDDFQKSTFATKFHKENRSDFQFTLNEICMELQDFKQEDMLKKLVCTSVYAQDLAHSFADASKEDKALVAQNELNGWISKLPQQVQQQYILVLAHKLEQNVHDLTSKPSPQPIFSSRIERGEYEGTEFCEALGTEPAERLEFFGNMTDHLIGHIDSLKDMPADLWDDEIPEIIKEFEQRVALAQAIIVDPISAQQAKQASKEIFQTVLDVASSDEEGCYAVDDLATLREQLVREQCFIAGNSHAVKARDIAAQKKRHLSLVPKV